MTELNNTFKVVITGNEGKETESIMTGPIVFSTSINGETSGVKYTFRLREYSEGYDVETLSLSKVSAQLIENFDRSNVAKIGVYYLTVSNDYRKVFEKNVANIADMVFEYNNDIGDKSYANSYNTIAELNITYTPEAVN